MADRTKVDQAYELLQGYSAELPNQIKREVNKAWDPMINRSARETQRQMSEFLPNYWAIPEKVNAGQASGLSPTQALSLMGRELGTMGGRLSRSSAVTDYLGGQMSDIYNRAMQAVEMGRQQAQGNYDRLFQDYQLRLQLEEAEKDRALRSRLASMNKPQSLPMPGANDFLRYNLSRISDPNELYSNLKEIEQNQALFSDPAVQQIVGDYWNTWRGKEYGDWARGVDQSLIDNAINRFQSLGQSREAALNALANRYNS